MKGINVFLGKQKGDKHDHSQPRRLVLWALLLLRVTTGQRFDRVPLPSF